MFEMAPAAPVEGCPLTARGCARLQWLQRPGEFDCAVRLVPFNSIQRLVHVVPDFDDFSARSGFSVSPALASAPLSESISMRYILNALYPWEK